MGNCKHCGSTDLPQVLTDTVVINLESGGPTAEEALERLTQQVRAASEAGIRALIVIHGYGSSGYGGKIKWVLRDALEHNYFSDRVDEYYFGEDLALGSAGYQAITGQAGLPQNVTGLAFINAAQLRAMATSKGENIPPAARAINGVVAWGTPGAATLFISIGE
jgi:hypothetical protein